MESIQIRSFRFRITGTPWNQVGMEVPLDPGSGGSTQVESDMDQVGSQGSAEDPLRAIDRLGHALQLGWLQLAEPREVPVWDHQHVAYRVGVEIENRVRVR